MNKLTIKKMAKDLSLEIIHNVDKDIFIMTSEINRPGLQLAGFYEYFAYERVQIIGKMEWHYLKSLSQEERLTRVDALMKYEIPCLIISRGMEVFHEIIETAKKYERPILRTDLSTTKFVSKLINYLEDKLAPTVTLNGVLVDIDGIGMLIFGESGIGKSECALELVKRGHRLVSDDLVEIKKVDDNTLEGRAPEMIRNYLELRGVGIIDISRLYGMGAIRENKTIDLIVQLEEWDYNKSYDRLGIDEEYATILDVKLSKLTIPVRPGRNLAVILEAAARNHIQKKMGHIAALELEKNILNVMEKNK